MGDLSTPRELIGALALGFQAAAVVAVGWRVGRRVGGADPVLVLLVGALTALSTAIGTVLLLAVVGLLSLPASVAVHALLVLAAWRGATPQAPDGWPSPRATGAVALVAVAAAGGYLALGADLSVGPPSADFDTREYHVANLASWLQDGHLWDLPYQSPSGISATHPGDAELLGVWLALPSHGDELVYLVPVLFGGLAVAAGAALARELGGSGAAGALVVVAVLLAPLYLSTQVASLSTDITVAACVTAALALLVAASRRDTPSPLVAASGVAIGLGLGSKYTALLPAAAVVVAAAMLLRPRRAWWWLVPGIATLAGPWFLRNLLATGNPLFPQELGPLPGSDSPFEAIDDTMLEHLLAVDVDIVGEWLRLGGRFVGVAALLAAGGLVAAGVRRAPWRWVVAAVTVVAFAGYLAVPFSGGGPLGFHHLIASSLRYAMTALVLGAVLLAGSVSRRVAVTAAVAVLVVDLWRVRHVVPDQRPDLAFGDAVLARAVLIGLAVAALVRWAPWRRLPPSVTVLGVGALVAVAGFGGLHRYDRGDRPSPLEAALVAAGDLDDPVVPLGVVDLRSMLGPRLDRELVVVSRGGKADEVPFSTADQVRRILLGDAAAPQAPPELHAALDAALRAAPADLLAVGPELAGAYPEGWTPDAADWCPVGTASGIALFERCTP